MPWDRIKALVLICAVVSCGMPPSASTLGVNGEDVSKTYPPDGWIVGVGTWGTDMDHATDQYMSGDSSVKFEDTTPAANPYMQSYPAVPCVAGDVFSVEGWVRADNAAALALYERHGFELEGRIVNHCSVQF